MSTVVVLQEPPVTTKEGRVVAALAGAKTVRSASGTGFTKESLVLVKPNVGMEPQLSLPDDDTGL